MKCKEFSVTHDDTLVGNIEVFSMSSMIKHNDTMESCRNTSQFVSYLSNLFLVNVNSIVGYWNRQTKKGRNCSIWQNFDQGDLYIKVSKSML